MNFLQCPALTSSARRKTFNFKSDFSEADQVNFTVEKVWKPLHFKMHFLKNCYNDRKSLAYTSLMRSIPRFRGDISALDPVQKKQLNLHIIGTIQNGKIWHSAGR
jgi:hypothetical protein